MKNNLINMSLEELIQLDNETTILSFSEFLKVKKVKLLLLSIIVHYTHNSNLAYILANDYIKYRTKLPIYKVLIDLYNNFLDDLVSEIRKSSIDKDPLSISILLGDFLIPCGYISYTKEFHPTNSEKLFGTDNDYDYDIEVYDLLGSYVATGYGCCRHINSFVSDVINKLDIKSDKIAAISNFNNQDPINNHLITGYIENEQYHLIDSYTHNYSLQKNNDRLITIQGRQIIPDFNFSITVFKNLHWNSDIKFQAFTETEIIKKREKIKQALINGELERFQKFKQKHLDTFEKIAYLVPLESNRTEEKEKQKSLKNYQ